MKIYQPLLVYLLPAKPSYVETKYYFIIIIPSFVLQLCSFLMSVFFLSLFSFLQKVFLKSDRVARMVHSGGCSANDFRDVFKKNIEKRVRSLPEIDGLSKETVLSSWLAKYDAIYRGEEDFCKQPNRMALSAVSELILSKEQLYEMFQQILGIKKLEHQLIYNACQVSTAVTRVVFKIFHPQPLPTGRASHLQF